MKRWILSAGLLFSLATIAGAQTKNQKSNHKKGAVKAKSASAGKAATADRHTVVLPGAGTTLNAIGHYNAKSTSTLPGAAGRLQIADPTVKALNFRSSGYDVPVSSSGIVGMPKSAYGYANGRILFRRTDATTFGTSTGSGAVGTGSSVGALGSSGTLMGVNGKSPYAGPDIYNLPITDGREGAGTYGEPTRAKESKKRSKGN